MAAAVRQNSGTQATKSLSADGAYSVPDSISVTDGIIRIRPPETADTDLLRRWGRDLDLPSGRAADCDEFRPIGMVIDGDEIVGWVGYGADREWLTDGEVQVRYHFANPLCCDGHAVRAVHLLMHHLATRARYHTAVLQADPRDSHSLAVAVATRFTCRDAGEYLFARPVPPLSYTDGVVTIRRQCVDDIGAHLAAIDDEQIDWLWEPGDRERWEALTPDQQRAHNLRHLRASHDSFGRGPKWAFSVDGAGTKYIAYVDCDLANNHVPLGEANIAYAAHPAHRGHGNVSRAVRLLTQFLRDHTGARAAHIVVDVRNTASLRVARAVGATESERWRDEHGRIMIRHVLTLR